MARLGIDYGTTNTVVVCSDRGRYPVVPHLAETAIGPVAREVFPSLAAYDRENGRFVFGSEVERCMARPGAEERYGLIRSLKRLIRDYTEGVRFAQDIVPGGFDPAAVLTAFLESLRESVRGSGLLPADEPLEAVITWPANANGAQRYLTRHCFRQAGFGVLSTLNEPTAAAIEFADRMARGNRMEARKLDLSIGVFDLGGGTFDVSLVRIGGSEFTVVDSAGIERLGGDDFDDVLARMFARQLGIEIDALRPFQRTLLLLHARQQKESICTEPVRSLTLHPDDLGLRGAPCTVPVLAFFEEIERLLVPALARMEALVNGPAARRAGIDGALNAVYLVGGSTRLPLVPKLIASRFPGVRLIMTDKPFSAIAMGAAIQSTEDVQLHEVLARTFGVLRLADGGVREYFDAVFPGGTKLPERGGLPLEHSIEYGPRHNIGHLRYMECSAIGADGWPAEGVREWSDVLFPYDPQIPAGHKLTSDQIVARDNLADKRVRETYSCDADGVITVRIRRECDGMTGCYEVFRN